MAATEGYPERVGGKQVKMSVDFSASLKEVDRIEILTLMDNYADLLLPDTEVITRPQAAVDGDILPDTLLAEYGLSLLITVHEGGNRHTILYDTGYSQTGVPHNMALLGLDPGEIEAIVLSHGHMDHTGALYAILDNMPGDIPLVLHPDAFLAFRYFDLEGGRKLVFPKVLERNEPRLKKVALLERRGPSLIADDTFLVTGEIEHTTDFETGFPNTMAVRHGEVADDPVLDDQGLVVKLKGKGLVVIAGCCHAGIINTVLFAQKITDTKKVHAVLGGFHLAGAFFEKNIEETIVQFNKIGPAAIVPMHCTGWKALLRFQEAFPASFVLNCVGSIITLP